MKKPKLLLYFGADDTWRNLQKIGFRRRNTCLLKALIENGRFTTVGVVRQVVREEWASSVLKSGQTKVGTSRVVDVYVSKLLPERWFGHLFRWVNSHLMRAQIAIQLRSRLTSNLISWCYWPAAYRLRTHIKLSGSVIFDVDHNILLDENQSAGCPQEVFKTLESAARSEITVVANSRSILRWFDDRSTKTYLLREGVDPERFIFPRKPFEKGKPRIGYIGVLSGWIDYHVFARLVDLKPEWEFVVIGAKYGNAETEVIKRKTNINMVGPKTFQEVPEAISSFAVALSLYKKEPGMDLDSMKLFEYLSAGIPVVSIKYHQDIDKDFEGLIAFAESHTEFAQKIEEILNWSEQVYETWRLKALNFCIRSSWETRVSQFLNLI